MSIESPPRSVQTDPDVARQRRIPRRRPDQQRQRFRTLRTKRGILRFEPFRRLRAVQGLDGVKSFAFFDNVVF